MPEALAFLGKHPGNEEKVDIYNLLAGWMAIAPWLYGALLILLVALGLWSLFDYINRRKKHEEASSRSENRFKYHFGFDLKLLQDGDLSYAQCQVVVDRRLSELAEIAHVFFQDQERLRQRRTEDSGELASLAEHIRAANKRADRCIEEFWEAVALAKEAGLKVREKYTDYLPTSAYQDAII